MGPQPRPARSKAPRAAAILTALASMLAVPLVPANSEEEALVEVRAADLEGKIRTLADFPGRVTLLLFWQPDIERSRKALCAIAELASGFEPAALATIVPGPHAPGEITRALASCPRQPSVLLDPERNISAALQIVAFPALLMVGPDRRLKFKVAGFGTEGVGAAQARLEEFYGKRHAPVAASAAAPQAVRRFGMARQLLKLGMTGQAETVLESLTAEHPEFRPAWVLLGYRRVAGDQADLAKVCFERALALDPKASDVAPGLAWVSWKKGDVAQTMKWAAAVDHKDPHYGLIVEIRGKSGPGRE